MHQNATSGSSSLQRTSLDHSPYRRLEGDLHTRARSSAGGGVDWMWIYVDGLGITIHEFFGGFKKFGKHEIGCSGIWRSDGPNPRRSLEIPNGFGYPQVDIIRKRFRTGSRSHRFATGLLDIGILPVLAIPKIWHWHRCFRSWTITWDILQQKQPQPQSSIDLFLNFYTDTHKSIQINLNLNPS